ncbi:MAG: hypothetical protein M3186_17000 [Actinomycetota bacterium]|nr:hypothetical protein [Actinomycetota bacterium]
MSELARHIRALTRDVASLRADIEQYRTELRAALDRFLDERAPTRPFPPAVLSRCSCCGHLGQLDRPICRNVTSTVEVGGGDQRGYIAIEPFLRPSRSE